MPQTEISPLPLRVTLRPAAPPDRPFIIASWLASLRRVPRWDALPSGWYHAAAHALISELLGCSTVLVADAAPDVIAGWAASQGPNVLHYVYVKAAYRRHGVGSALVGAALPGGPRICSHWTPAMSHVADRWEAHYDAESLSVRLRVA